jgi:hypothetical protein
MPIEDFSKNQQICGPVDATRGRGPEVDQSVMRNIYDAIEEDFKAGGPTPGRGMDEKMLFGEFRAGLPEAIIHCADGTSVTIDFQRDYGTTIGPPAVTGHVSAVEFKAQ